MSDYFEKLEEYREKASRLRECADMLHTEQGEAWRLLGDLFEKADYVSHEMEEALYEEIDHQIEHIEENYDVVEETGEYSEKRLEYVQR